MRKSDYWSFGGHFFFLFVVTLILFGSVGCSPDPTPTSVNTLRSPPTEKPASHTTTPLKLTLASPTLTIAAATPIPTIEALDIPLGIGIYNADNVEVFNKYAREQDVIAARPPFMYLLDEVERGQKKLVFAPRDEPLTDIQSIISEAKSLGVTIIGYNLEMAVPRDDLIRREAEMQVVASRNDVLYVFGPTLLKLEKFYDDFARHADVILLQSQHYQTTEEYEERVEDLIEKIRFTNPEVQVWVQVSVNPPTNRQITPEEVISDIQLITDRADLIWIYYVPKTASVMEEVFKRLRR